MIIRRQKFKSIGATFLLFLPNFSSFNFFPRTNPFTNDEKLINRIRRVRVLPYAFSYVRDPNVFNIQYSISQQPMQPMKPDERPNFVGLPSFPSLSGTPDPLLARRHACQPNLFPIFGFSAFPPRAKKSLLLSPILVPCSRSFRY